MNKDLSEEVIGAAIEVHRALGPGLLKSAYTECLCRELSLRNIAFTRQQPLPISYKGVKLDCGHTSDLIVDSEILLDIRSVEKFEPLHDAQLLTYLRLSSCKVGLLLNFNIPLLKDGIRRRVVGYPHRGPAYDPARLREDAESKPESSNRREIDWNLTERVIGAAIEVHRALGPGLLECVYEECLCHELFLRNLGFVRQRALPISYKGVTLDCGYRLDVLVNSELLLEIKAVEKLEPIHEAQLLSYLRLGGLNLGLLMNFNVPVLKDGIRRRVLNYPDQFSACSVSLR
jgi:GxxExxY protein